MSKILKTSIVAAALAGWAALTPRLHAEEPTAPQESHDPMMSPGMMDGESMMPMMEDASQMGEMMDHCSQMMSGGMDGGSGRPNEQWRNDAPVSPDENE